ncbi:MAG: GAP family protein [Actinomycetota bacterium]|nr:GAP family protein [Actinomycetota bacterium]
MLRLIGLVVSIGLADSLNPTTIAPALYLASGERARERVTQFTLGVFLVNLIAGAAVALGPGQLLLSLIPRPHHQAKAVIEIVVGFAMVIAAGVLWRKRGSLSQRDPPSVSAAGRSSALLGATITVVELPTAFPYFAVITAIVVSDHNLGHQLVLLLLFNLCFVLPLLLIVIALWVAGENAVPLLAKGRRFLQRRWPVVLSGLALLAGAFVVTLGVTNLFITNHSDFGTFSRSVHSLLHFGHKR